MKGFIEIENFQSLKGLLIEAEKIVEDENEITFHFRLKNTNNRIIFTKHISEPVLGMMQNGAEFFSVHLTQSSAKNEISPGATAALIFSVPKSLFDSNQSLSVYTRSKHNVRGELISVRPGK